MRVVFPDPFGPTSPIVPGDRSTERFPSASTGPNRFVTDSVRKSGPATDGQPLGEYIVRVLGGNEAGGPNPRFTSGDAAGGALNMPLRP